MYNNRAKRPPLDPHARPAATLTVIAPIVETAAAFAAGFPLRQASFVRRGDHLAVIAAGYPDTIVPRFFTGDAVTTLATRDGMEMSRHMVLLMLNVSDRVGRVLSDLAVPGGRDAS